MEPDPASYAPRLAAQMVTVERQGVAEGRPSTQSRLRMAEYPQETIKKTDQNRFILNHLGMGCVNMRNRAPLPR